MWQNIFSQFNLSSLLGHTIELSSLFKHMYMSPETSRKIEDLKDRQKVR